MHFTKILFYEDNYSEPLDPRSINRLLLAFPRSYVEVTKIIVENSEDFSEVNFKRSVALLMRNFKMTRSGAFKGIRFPDVLKQDNVIDSCWKGIRKDLEYMRECLDKNSASSERGFRFLKLSDQQRESVVEKTRAMFRTLCRIIAERGQKRHARVGASKVLFAAIPEVALPVDNTEWKKVFQVDDYGEVLRIMVEEIKRWQAKTGKLLYDCAPLAYQPTTIPSIYNALAMSVRPMESLSKPRTVREYNKFFKGT